MPSAAGRRYLFTLFYDPDRVSPLIRSHRVHASFLQPFRKRYRSLLPLMPMALESFDLARLRSGGLERIGSRQRRDRAIARPPRLLLPHAHALPVGSVSGVSQRVDALALQTRAHGAARPTISGCGTTRPPLAWTSSSPTARTCAGAFGKPIAANPSVVHPPVAVETFYSKPPEDYYLIVSEFVAYKRLDAADQRLRAHRPQAPRWWATARNTNR